MKAKSVSSLKKKLDKLFSVWVRQQGMNWREEIDCFTCGKRDYWKKLQAGHFIGRSDNNLRYDPMNVHPQCVACNVFKGGNMVLYAIKMKQKYGDDIIENLYKKSQKAKSWSVKELEALIKKYG